MTRHVAAIWNMSCVGRTERRKAPASEVATHESAFSAPAERTTSRFVVLGSQQRSNAPNSRYGRPQRPDCARRFAPERLFFGREGHLPSRSDLSGTADPGGAHVWHRAAARLLAALPCRTRAASPVPLPIGKPTVEARLCSLVHRRRQHVSVASFEWYGTQSSLLLRCRKL